MLLNFAEVLSQIGDGAAVRVANSARPPANYLFNTFLPERMQPDYSVEAATMIVRTTMAGLVAMDSPYPPGGTLEIGTFLENSAKIGVANTLTEGALRQIQSLLREMMLNGTGGSEFLVGEALNFLNKVIIQALLDTDEWLRGQALVYGLINWTFNKKNLYVDYGIPTANKLPTRTDANNDSYSDSASAFWTDVRAAQTALRYDVRAAIMNSATFNKIVNNSVNAIQLISQSLNGFTVRRYTTVGGNTVLSNDTRDGMTFIIYDEEAEVLDTSPAASFGTTQRLKYMPDGKILFVGGSAGNRYRVGLGSTDDPRNDLELGYHAICPTVENSGKMGRWARLYVPQGYPMQLRGEGVENSLPVIYSPQRIVIATTEMLP